MCARGKSFRLAKVSVTFYCILLNMQFSNVYYYINFIKNKNKENNPPTIICIFVGSP